MKKPYIPLLVIMVFVIAATVLITSRIQNSTTCLPPLILVSVPGITDAKTAINAAQYLGGHLVPPINAKGTSYGLQLPCSRHYHSVQDVRRMLQQSIPFHTFDVFSPSDANA